MHENGAAEAGPRGKVIVPKLDNDVIDMILPPKNFVIGGIGQGNQPVVSGIFGRITPPIVLVNLA